jgi:hypothetical protein
MIGHAAIAQRFNWILGAKIQLIQFEFDTCQIKSNVFESFLNR